MCNTFKHYKHYKKLKSGGYENICREERFVLSREKESPRPYYSILSIGKRDSFFLEKKSLSTLSIETRDSFSLEKRSLSIFSKERRDASLFFLCRGKIPSL